MRKILGGIRFLFFIIISIFYMTRIFLTNLILAKSMDRTLNIRRNCFRRFIQALGVEVEVVGNLPKETCIVMSNHRSYFDPLTIMKDVLILPVIKAEVSKWPLIGQGAEMSGVVFVNRTSRESRKETVEKMEKILDDGYNIIIFPEGTTHDQPTTIDFKMGAFKVAAEKEIPIIAVAIEYTTNDDYWIGDDTFVPHFLSCFGKVKTQVRIEYSDVIRATDPQELMDKTKAWIDAKMLTMRQDMLNAKTIT